MHRKWINYKKDEKTCCCSTNNIAPELQKTCILGITNSWVRIRWQQRPYMKDVCLSNVLGVMLNAAAIFDFKHGGHLSWLQTRLTALPFHGLITACHFIVVALSGQATLAFSPSGIALKLNRCQLSAVCHCGQSSEVIDWLAWCCSLLGLSSAASGTCAVVQKSPSKWQCRNGKLVWKQH